MRAERLLPNVPVTTWLNYKAEFPLLSSTTGVIYTSGTWTPPQAGSYEISCVGGGGGGSSYYGAGGGSGYLTVSTQSLTVQAYTVTCGAGGARGTGYSANGSAGGQTIFGASLVVANGGSGGISGWSSTGTGGAGGSGGGAACDASNSRPAWGGGGGGWAGSNGGYSPYKQTGYRGAGGTGSQSVVAGKGTESKIPSGGAGAGPYNFIAGTSGPLSAAYDGTIGAYSGGAAYAGIYGHAKSRGSNWNENRKAFAGNGGGGCSWWNGASDGGNGFIVWKFLG